MNMTPTTKGWFRVRLVLGAAIISGSAGFFVIVVRALASEIGGEFLAGVSLTVIASGAAAAILAMWVGRPIEEATALATRFAAGETHLRLDPSKGIATFRDLAVVLNSLADQVTNRERQFDLVSEATGDAVSTWDPLTNELVWHGRWHSLFGGTGETLRTTLAAWFERLHPDDRERIEAGFQAAVSGPGRTWSEEYRFRVSDGSYRWLWDRAVILRDNSGRAISVVGCMTDINRQRAAEDRIWHLANRDGLTGLPNRALFQKRIEAMMARESDRTGALLLFDIDHFKEVNDTLGHAAGDGLLACLAQRLRDCVPEPGIVCRLGGDEFAVLLPFADADEAAVVADCVLTAIREPVRREMDVLRPRATIGVALIPEHGATPSEILKSADIALYHGKAEGRDRIAMFEPGLRTALEVRSNLVSEVRDGLERGEFEAYYQPIVLIQDGSAVAVEALMRWNHRERGTLPPSEFIAALGDPEVALAFGKTLMRQVVGDYRCWMDAGIAPDYAAVNVSSAGLHRPDFAERIFQRLEQAGVPFSCLALEVTETVFFGGTTGGAKVKHTLAALHSAGIRIALDDFGTGFASLTHLRQLPVDIIKIDQSFVRSLVADRGSQAIVSAVLELGRGLGKTVVAEGVETEDHATMLRAAGCVEAQGYLYARPMPERALRDYLSRQATRRPSRPQEPASSGARS